MNIKQFIPITIFKENSLVHFNIDDQILSASLLDAQDIVLRQNLTSKLYAKFVSLVDTNTLDSVGNEVYANLFYDYCVDVIMRWAMVYANDYSNVKTRNTGNVKLTSDQSASADDSSVVSVNAVYRNNAEFYSEQLIKHLAANCNLYPEYLDNTSIEDLKPMGTAYFSGTQFRKRNVYANDFIANPID